MTGRLPRHRTSGRRRARPRAGGRAWGVGGRRRRRRAASAGPRRLLGRAVEDGLDLVHHGRRQRTVLHRPGVLLSLGRGLGAEKRQRPRRPGQEPAQRALPEGVPARDGQVAQRRDPRRVAGRGRLVLEPGRSPMTGGWSRTTTTGSCPRSAARSTAPRRCCHDGVARRPVRSGSMAPSTTQHSRSWHASQPPPMALLVEGGAHLTQMQSVTVSPHGRGCPGSSHRRRACPASRPPPCPPAGRGAAWSGTGRRRRSEAGRPARMGLGGPDAAGQPGSRRRCTHPEGKTSRKSGGGGGDAARRPRRPRLRRAHPPRRAPNDDRCGSIHERRTLRVPSIGRSGPELGGSRRGRLGGRSGARRVSTPVGRKGGVPSAARRWRSAHRRWASPRGIRRIPGPRSARHAGGEPCKRRQGSSARLIAIAAGSREESPAGRSRQNGISSSSRSLDGPE